MDESTDKQPAMVAKAASDPVDNSANTPETPSIDAGAEPIAASEPAAMTAETRAPVAATLPEPAVSAKVKAATAAKKATKPAPKIQGQQPSRVRQQGTAATRKAKPAASQPATTAGLAKAGRATGPASDSVVPGSAPRSGNKPGARPSLRAKGPITDRAPAATATEAATAPGGTDQGDWTEFGSKTAEDKGATSSPSDAIVANALAFQKKLFSFAQANLEANFEFLREAARVRDLGGLTRLQHDYLRETVSSLTAQATELARLAQKALQPR